MSTIAAAAKKVQEAKLALETKQAHDRQYFKETSSEVAEAWKNLQLHKVEFKVGESSFIATENGININKHIGHLGSDTIDALRGDIIKYLESIAVAYRNQ